MTRNLKVLGLAISAMLIFGAMASMASAAEFHSETSTTTTLEGEQASAFNDEFVTDAGKTTCETATYSGSQSGATAATASATPSYSGCTASFGLSVEIHVNGCQYVFHAGNGTVDIVCPAGSQIEITAPGCVVTVGSQTGINGITYTNSGTGSSQDIVVHVNSNNIKYEEHNKGFFPTCKSNTVATTGGTYKGEATVRGFNGKSQTGIWWQ